MYGHRARIGYTSPPYLTETFPYEFYKMVPDGVMLTLTTLAIKSLTNHDEIKKSVDMTLDAAREMGRAGVNLVVFGGVPLNLSLGYEGLKQTMRDTEQEIGVPVTSSLTAQINALRRLDADKIVVVHPFAADAGYYPDYLRHAGFELRGVRGVGKQVGDLACIASQVAEDLARELYQDHPDADTIYFPAPHWGIIDVINPLEQDLGVNVVTAMQAIVWESLRGCGIQDRIAGYGRLLRAF